MPPFYHYTIVFVCVLCSFSPAVVAGKKKVTALVNDPRFKDQWYLGQLTNDYPGRHNSILSAWRQGATGKDVLIAMLDNGIQLDHPDLKKNIDVKSSFNYLDPRAPAEPSSLSSKFRHGTEMAGIISMVANNKKCGIGVAFNSKIASVKILGPVMNATQHAASHSHLRNKVHIYSESYGPYDNGKIVSRYHPHTIQAILTGVKKGRYGLGSIYIKSCGSGGPKGDHCGADGTVNIIYNIAVAAAARDHKIPHHSEECAAILTSVYTQHTNVSGGKGRYTDVITLGVNSSCIETKGGSSTATAIASGIIALALSVNKKLSWRDVQYLVVAASKRNGLGGKWVRNGARFQVSHRYGFGILDAGRMVELAKSWRRVKKMGVCYTPYLVRLKKINVDVPPMNSTYHYTIPLQGCPTVNVVEHVSVVTSTQFSRRGDIEVRLTSPSKTTSLLLGGRKNDSSKRYYWRWKLTSVHYWGEKVEGDWKLTITFLGKGKGVIRNTYIIFYGTNAGTGYALPRRRYNLPNQVRRPGYGYKWSRGRGQGRGRGRGRGREWG